MRTLTFILVILLLQLGSFAQQQFTINGIIRDALNGAPVTSVTITASASRQSALSGADGRFTIILTRMPDTLRCSAAGFNSSGIVVNKNTALPLQLSLTRKTRQMDTVTVYNTGYQLVNGKGATGSFTQADNEVLNRQVGTNVLTRLEGVASGINFNKKNDLSPAISVRGLSSINGPTSPLIVLDDFPFEGDIASINPSLVESITILKDAAAAAIWGTKAGNGVIVITTRKSRLGQPFRLSFNSTIQLSGKPNLDYQKTIAVSDYIDMEKWLFSKGYYNSTINSSYHPPISPVVELLDRQAKGIITAAEAEQKINALRNDNIKDDYNRYIYTNALGQQYGINCSGGSSKFSWSANGGYDKSISELSARSQRINASLETEFKPLEKLKLNTGLLYASLYSGSGKKGYMDEKNVYPYSRLFANDGTPLPAAVNYRLAFTDTALAGKLLDWNYYPGDDYKHRYSNTGSNNLLANIGMQYSFAKGFTISVKYRYEAQWSNTDNVSDAQSYQARYTTNMYTQVNPATGAVTYIVPKAGILDMSSTSLRSHNLRSQLAYNYKSQKHKLELILGAESRRTNEKAASSRVYGYDPSRNTTALVDLVNRYPVFPNGDMTTVPSGNLSLDETQRNFLSYYGNAGYTFNNKYSISLSGRRDASNLFGVNTNQKWVPLWSAGMAWNISDENFYHISWLPRLVLRTSYGFTGNADPGRSAVVTLNFTGNSSNTGFPLARINQFPNPNLRWEKVAITNVGIDFAAANNRISGTLEGYIKKGIDLFGSTEVDITAGLGQNSLVTNAANMKGKGISLVLNTVNTTRKIKWSSSLLLDYNTDKVTKAYITNYTASRYLSDGSSITALEGRPVHSIISFRWAGLNPQTGYPQGYLNGVVSQDYASITGAGTSINDLEYNGPALPQWMGALYNHLKWKNLELGFNITWKLGHYFRHKSVSYGDLYAGGDKKGSSDFANRWQQPGDEQFTDVPAMIYPFNSSLGLFYNSAATLVEKADHIRLQFVNLSYTLPVSQKAKRSVNTIQFYINASNLGIIWRANKRGIDPDYALAAIPPSKTWAIGLKLNLQ